MNDTPAPTAGKVATIGLSTLATTALKFIAGALVAHGYIQASGTEAFIGAGMIVLTYAYSFWCEYGSVIAKAGFDILRAKVLDAAAKAKQGVTPSAAALASVAAHVQATTPAGGPVGAAEKSVVASTAIKAVIAFLAIAVALSFAMPAMAETQTKRSPLTGNIVNDINSAVGQQVAQQASPANASACDFNTFTLITPQNVVSVLQGCGEKLLTDSQAGLASAKTANDNIAMGCLTPGTALVQAAIGTPAVPATATAPEVPAVLAGPILIFQKFREFVNAGGITNCKAWVSNTITAATASGL
jgi:hypothetical protein